MTRALTIFVSSKMEELRPERELLQALIPELLYGVVELRPFVYEKNAPASNEGSRPIYLNELRQSALYVGLFWKDYGEWTIDEFKKASEWGIERHIYIKNLNTDRRDPRLADFLDRISDIQSGPATKWFGTEDELRDAFKQSIEVWVANRLWKSPERRERLARLQAGRKSIEDALREYLNYLDDYPDPTNEDQHEHSRIINNAIMSCLDCNDVEDEQGRKCLDIQADKEGFEECSRKYKNRLAYIARLRLTPHRVDYTTPGPQQQAEVNRWGPYGSRNRDALIDALSRLDELIDELQQ